MWKRNRHSEKLNFWFGNFYITRMSETKHSLVLFMSRHMQHHMRKTSGMMRHQLRSPFQVKSEEGRYFGLLHTNRSSMSKVMCKHCQYNVSCDYTALWSTAGRSSLTVQDWGRQKKGTWYFTCQSNTNTSLRGVFRRIHSRDHKKSLTVTTVLQNFVLQNNQKSQFNSN